MKTYLAKVNEIKQTSNTKQIENMENKTEAVSNVINKELKSNTNELPSNYKVANSIWSNKYITICFRNI